MIENRSRIPRGRRLAVPTWLALIAVIMLPAGCSTTQWLYGNADWFVERYAVKSLDIDDAQLQDWRPQLQSILQRHLNSELPLIDLYLNLLTEFVERVPDEPVDTACLVHGATELFERHARLAAELAVPLLVKLEPHQISHLEAYLAQRHSRYEKRFLNGDRQQRLQARTERLIERIENWTGALDNEQLAQVEGFATTLPDLAASWFDYRRNREERLLQLLRAEAGADQLHHHLLSWWIPWSAEKTEFSKVWKPAEAGFIRLLDDLAPSFNERQREHVKNKVAALRGDIADLYGGAPLTVNITSLKMRCPPQHI